MRILFDSKNSAFKSPYGCVTKDESCTINIHIPQTCITKKVYLYLEGEKELKYELHKTDNKNEYDVFSVTFSLKNAGLYFYYFHIKTTLSSFDLFKYGYTDTNIGEGQKWQLSCIPKDFKVDDSFKGKVMYQIFPDRFFKHGECDLTGKLMPYTIHRNTQELPDYLANENGEILNNDFFGGNLKGIEKKLLYLKELGISIIYLNPIFKAFSNHRYDTCDYKTIDPMLGTEEEFKNLCEEAHRLEIKIILDGVFSHTGSDSIYFDIKNRFGTGVVHNQNSPFSSWYSFKQNGEYDCWWGIKTLPCVNELSEDFVNYIIKNDDSVVKHWLNLGADGFRLDVADELPDEFIKLLYNEVHKTKPNSIIWGEVWEDASNKTAYGVQKRYFTDTELDSVMNYPFRNAIIDLVCGYISTEDFAEKILTITENYPKEATDCLMNSLSTHDTIRIMTVLSGAPCDLNRLEAAKYLLSDAQKEKARELIKTAVLLQFFLPGNSCIYYGDETGAFGFADPFNRGYFNWNNTHNEISEFYKAISKIKNNNSAFVKGEIQFLNKENGMLIMKRIDDKNEICAMINFSSKAYKTDKKTALICHNTTFFDNVMYIQKNGFIVF